MVCNNEIKHLADEDVVIHVVSKYFGLNACTDCSESDILLDQVMPMSRETIFMIDISVKLCGFKPQIICYILQETEVFSKYFEFIL